MTIPLMPASAFSSRILFPALLAIFLLNSGCQLGYIVDSGYNQMRLLAKKRRFENVLKDPHVDEETKRKIRLVQEAKNFAEQRVGLAKTSSYESFVVLDDKYVTYALSAAYKDRLEPYMWKFPIVGEVPYKGFFKKEKAFHEQDELKSKGLDTYVRGVSAYSTLGWFADPLLSSMTAYQDEDLVETIFHETTHATVYIKSNADFNERLATFVGLKGMEEFYLEKEGPGSKKVLNGKQEQEDTKIFSEWLGVVLKELDEFYKKSHADLEKERQAQFRLIHERFKKECLPRLKTDAYAGFAESEINNAVLIANKTYFMDLDLFEKAFEKQGRDWKKFIEYFKSIKKSTDPEKELRGFISSR